MNVSGSTKNTTRYVIPEARSDEESAILGECELQMPHFLGMTTENIFEKPLKDFLDVVNRSMKAFTFADGWIGGPFKPDFGLSGAVQNEEPKYE